MRYKLFRIQNFKGIKDTTIQLDAIAGASVFAFVGLNESGKTTVLEAIHSFSPDGASAELLGGEGVGVPYSDRVPRHLISSFSGDISVSATLSVNADDKEKIADKLKNKHQLELNVAAIGDEITLERFQRFKDGDFKTNFFTLRTPVEVRSTKQRRWRAPVDDEVAAVRDAFYSFTPDIAYFPTFVFDFPERAFLTDRGTVVDRFYRKVFQDILDFDGRGHTIDKDIVRRVRAESLVVPWLAFLTSWGAHDDKAKIQHVMDRASMQVTKLVFGRWNKIFGEDTKGNLITQLHPRTEVPHRASASC